jgi:polysaccharide export outer membrane protein
MITFSLPSCVTHESLVNFEEGLPTGDSELIENLPPLRIQPNDLLRIQVHSIKEEAAAPFNLENNGQQGGGQMMMGGQQGGAGMERFLGYYVDEGGGIDFPVVGRIQLQGLTTREATRKIQDLVRPYLTDAVVNLRFLNFKVTILGEVNRPGVLQLSNQRVTLLEVLGQAGDLTDYARRDNILIAREQNGERVYARLNLQDYDIFQSPYFYLQQNDFIYVEPQRARIATVADPVQRALGYTTGIISLVSLIIALTSR